MPGAHAQSEAWKAMLNSKPSVSTRRGTANKYGPAYEDTSTLVLTAPSGKYVDIRFPLTVQPDTALNAHPEFWAFSGVSQTTFYDADSTQTRADGGESVTLPYTAHSTYTHEIDSKEPGTMDEGDFFLLPNGDAMEVGLWSDTGQMYKELWTGPEIQKGRDYVVKSPVVVVETTENNARGTGRLIRIGDYAQGIFAYDDHFLQEVDKSEGKQQAHTREKVLVQRILRTPEGEDMWHTDDRSNTAGSDILPWEKILGDFGKADHELAVGTKFESRGNQWIVVELVE